MREKPHCINKHSLKGKKMGFQRLRTEAAALSSCIIQAVRFLSPTIPAAGGEKKSRLSCNNLQVPWVGNIRELPWTFLCVLQGRGGRGVL